MAETPWLGDTCSLVEAFRRGERTPVEELDATLAAIAGSDLNAFSFLDADRARERAMSADVTKPFGGVPIGVKQLDHVAGWPATEASVPLRDRVAGHTSVMVERVAGAGGANAFGQTTASEFGGVNARFTSLRWRT